MRFIIESLILVRKCLFVFRANCVTPPSRFNLIPRSRRRKQNTYLRLETSLGVTMCFTCTSSRRQATHFSYDNNIFCTESSRYEKVTNVNSSSDMANNDLLDN